MIEVSLDCRECKDVLKPIKTVSEFEPHPKTKIADTQHHMDIHFKGRCQRCFGCNWEVVDVKEIEYVEA